MQRLRLELRHRAGHLGAAQALRPRGARQGAGTAGFTLVELMVTIVLIAILAMVAYPSFSGFIQNGQIRASAESLMSGLALARTESIRRNMTVALRLENTLRGEPVSGGTDWTVMAATPESPTVPDASQVVQVRRDDSSRSTARAGLADAPNASTAAAGAGLPATISFSATGRLSLGTTARQIDITGPTGSRPLRILLGPGGDMRLCDPALSLADNPQGCAS
ncbi:GspH/FimT family pseudopilin [Variovorax dokdonensis]|uniref:Type II secretion system protein H n=1 Tax=Variovorax dokdonensis TaxID=344883 RepID=A0ABT7N9L5_9BURK|nr:GspH/FimT family pseudopilin [Variovorax dokdonensis]MDM0044640.1 GspH/FimT family pseudopilin [Variovorax dokdonensis]